MAIVIAVYIAFAASNADIVLAPFVVAGVTVSVVVPIVGYPFSKTLWAAIDLVMHPPEVGEEAAALLFVTTTSPVAPTTS